MRDHPGRRVENLHSHLHLSACPWLCQSPNHSRPHIPPPGKETSRFLSRSDAPQCPWLSEASLCFLVEELAVLVNGYLATIFMSPSEVAGLYTNTVQVAGKKKKKTNSRRASLWFSLSLITGCRAAFSPGNRKHADVTCGGAVHEAVVSENDWLFAAFSRGRDVHICFPLLGKF